MQPKEQRTIYFYELSWDTVDNYIKNTLFKDSSSFLEYLASKEIYKKKYVKLKLFREIVVLLSMAIAIILLLLIFVRG
jgi:hypothetical protein